MWPRETNFENTSQNVGEQQNTFDYSNRIAARYEWLANVLCSGFTIPFIACSDVLSCMRVVMLSCLAPVCAVGDWSQWGECQSSRRCVPDEERLALTKTFKMEESDAWDWGRMVMQHMMFVKDAERAKKAECVAAGKCPSPMADRPSSGSVACVDGKPCIRQATQSFVAHCHSLFFVGGLLSRPR